MRLNLDSKVYLLLIGILLISLNLAFVLAHVEEEEIEEISLHDQLKSTSLNSILIATVIVTVLVIISLYKVEKSEKLKVFLFLGIAIPVLIATFYSAGSTIYLNTISETKGPVHWHADYEVWVCDKKIDLIKPKGLSNRIGNPLFHDHGDDRIHVEGVVVSKSHVDLHSFFETIGGDLDNNKLEFPTDEEVLEVKNGDSCNGKPGKLQVFLYRIKNTEDTKNWIFEERKVENFENYILSPYSQIPPGDCIIIEFGQEKLTTEHICETYKNAIIRGELVGS